MNLKGNISEISLIISNLIPLIGVVVWGYDLKLIILIYWMESLVLILFNFVKIKKAQGGITPDQMINGKVDSVMVANFLVDHSNPKVLSNIFLLRYGFFIFIYGVFVFNVFGVSNISWGTILINIIAISLSHFISYKVNFIGKGEYLNVSPSELASQPGGRMLVMHITIIAMGFFLIELGEPIYALIIMIILKIIIDLISHINEHKKMQSLVKINS